MINIKVFEVNYFSENTYLIYNDQKDAILIDCGCYRTQEKKELQDFIDSNGLNLKRLLCTHMHLDHVMGNEFIFETYGIRPEMHQYEITKMPSLEDQSKAFGLPTLCNSVEPAGYLKGGDIISLGNISLKVLSVPGHTPGGLAFYCEKEEFVIVGDSLFCGSIGRTDLWGGNSDLLQAAILDKLMTLPDKTIVYPGHGPETTIIDERRSNPFLTNH